MSHIIWKGTNSNSVKGILIQSLPPITKPKMRTSTTQIDGKDGDVVEYLGYESYSKQIKIALTRNYDIDEVMNYFNGIGELTLSNEPDKYYIAEIIDSIDYEKLINFKTAIVKYHVQPFKYLKDEKSYTYTKEENPSTEDSLFLEVENKGYEYSKPIITIYGTGTIQLLLNGLSVFDIDMDEEYITVDSEKEDAYFESTLKNRQMIGVFPKLNPGKNKITWVGDLHKIIVEPKSRWV